MLGSLNVLRMALALSVLLYHLSATIGLEKYFDYDGFYRVFGFAGSRIPFFFVLSGFLLTWIYIKDIGRADRVLPFLGKRFLRLYPSFWIVLLIVLAASWLVPAWRPAVPDDPWALLRMAMLWPQPASPADPTGAPVIVVAWTLHYEVLFCLLLAAWILNRWVGVAACTALAWNAIACWDGGCGFYSRWLAAPSVGYLACGAITACLVRRWPAWPLAAPVGGLAICLYLGMAWAAPPDVAGTFEHDALLMALACLIVACLVSFERTGHTVSNSALVKLLSDSSYALYLIHFPAISLVCKLVMLGDLPREHGAIVAFVAALLVSIGLAVAFHLGIERRVMSWR